jgi:hypothetical protein
MSFIDTAVSLSKSAQGASKTLSKVKAAAAKAAKSATKKNSTKDKNSTKNVDNDKSIMFCPFSVKLVGIYDTIQGGLDVMISEAPAKVKQGINEIINFYTSGDNAPKYMMLRKCRDTSFGGNDAINPYPQFHEDDDIMYPTTSFIPTTGGTIAGKTNSPHTIGEGRVYSEMIDDRQQIMYMTFGVPRYSSLSRFYTQSINADMANLMNNGEYSTLKKISALVGTVVGTVLALPIIPIIYVSRLMSAIAYPVTRFYDLKVAMPLYYQLVNSIVAHLSVNMHITSMSGDAFDKANYTDIINAGTDGTNNGNSTATKKSSYTTKTLPPTKQSKKGGASSTGSSTDMNGDVSSVASDLFRANSIDVLKLLSRKDIWDNIVKSSQVKGIDDHIKDLMAAAGGAGNGMNWYQFMTGFMSQFYRSMEFIGVRIEKSTDSSESATNTTGESEIASRVNSTIASSRNKQFTMAGGDFADNFVVKGIESAFSALVSMVASAAEAVGGDGIVNAMKQFSGGGYMDFPEMYQSSSFSKSYNFRMRLHAIYGDPLSIMYGIYLPFAFLMAAAFPRATGANSYTSPFLLRAYCRGMFAIPIGIIDSFTVTRGSSEYGWNYNNLPLVIDINFSIKDLSPVMFIAPSSAQWSSIFGNNTSFQEYMLTLGGTGLDERVSWLPRFENRVKTSFRQLLANSLNPMMIGYRFGNTNLVQFFANFTPVSRLPEAARNRK